MSTAAVGGFYAAVVIEWLIGQLTDCNRVSAAAVGGLYAAAGRTPTAAPGGYDLVAQPPLSQLTLSPCDVTEPTVWHFAVMLGPEEDAGGVDERNPPAPPHLAPSDPCRPPPTTLPPTQLELTIRPPPPAPYPPCSWS